MTLTKPEATITTSGNGTTAGNKVDPDTCDTNPSICNGYCTVGAASCAATDGTTGTWASVYVVCGKIA